jgi:hypothetical protein
MTSWNEQVARIERMRPKAQVPVKQLESVDADDGSELGKGVKAGLYQTAAVAPALASMAGKAVGADSVAEWGAEKASGLMEKAAEYDGETSFEALLDEPTLDGAANWVLHTAGTLLPTMLVGMTGAGIGAKVVGGAILKKTAKALIRKDAVRFVAAGASKKEAVKLAAQGVVAKATKYGAAAGIVGATAPMEAAHNFMTDVEQHGIENASPGKAALTGTAAGLVEVAFGGGHLRLVNKILGNRAGKSAVKSLATGAKGRFANAVKEAVIQGGGEGLQELTQEELSILNEIWTGEDQSLFEKKNLLRAGESFAAGAVMGVPAGGVTGVMNGSSQTQGEGDTGTKVKGRTVGLGSIPSPDEDARMEASEGDKRGTRGAAPVRSGPRAVSPAEAGEKNPIKRELLRRQSPEKTPVVKSETVKPIDQQAREANQKIIDEIQDENDTDQKEKEVYTKAQAQVVGDMLAKGDIDVQVASKRLKQIEKENKKWQKETAGQPAGKATSPVADQTKKATEPAVSPKAKAKAVEETPKANQPESPAQPPVQAKAPEKAEAVKYKFGTYDEAQEAIDKFEDGLAGKYGGRCFC